MALAPEIPMAVLARMVGEHDTRLRRVVKRHVVEARTQVDRSEVISVERAATYLRRWCNWVLRVAKRPKDPDERWVLEAMHRTALTLRENAHGILNYFRLRMTSGVIESVSSLAQAARARARGNRNADTFITMIYLIAGRLRFDLPDLTHSP